MASPAVEKKQRVAVIGGGVAGLAAAWHLANLSKNSDDDIEYEVHVFEAAERLGGHAYTINIPPSSLQKGQDCIDSGPNAVTTKADQKEIDDAAGLDVDIGFMVYNDDNYPNMVKWFEALKVETENSDMSLSVSLDRGKSLEWTSSNGLDGLFANRWQLASPSFYQFLSEMIRFHFQAPELLLLNDDDPRKYVTTSQYLSDHNYTPSFCTHYLLPMMAALWSASLEDVLQFPASQLIAFLQNHKMLQLFDRPQWKTVKGRSKEYTKKVYHSLGGDKRVHLSSPIHKVLRMPDGTYQLYKLDIHTTPTNGNGNGNGNAVSPTNSSSQDDDSVVIVHEEDDPDVALAAAEIAAPAVSKEPQLVTVANDDKTSSSFHHVIFACHTDTARRILQRGATTPSADGLGMDDPRLQLLSEIQYQDNVVYVHSDPHLMPKRKSAWASWNCLGKLEPLQEYNHHTSKHKGAAMEGSESGFGKKLAQIIHPTKEKAKKHEDPNHPDHHVHFALPAGREGHISELEGEEGRMKAVFVTYWLNRLQNLNSPHNIFVSLNPHSRPALHLTHRRVILAHPQFTPQTLKARKQLLLPSSSDSSGWQGKDGLWFCGAWAGYGFHEDGCRSGFEVATQLSQKPLPWAATATGADSNQEEQALMVLSPPDLSNHHTSGLVGLWWKIHNMLSYKLPVYVCKQFIYYFLRDAIVHGKLLLKMNDGSTLEFGDGNACGVGDHEPVTLRVFDEWFFVKVAVEYDLGLARSYMAGHFTVLPLQDKSKYHPVMRPTASSAMSTALVRDETNITLGDPIGLTRFFLLIIGNRDRKEVDKHVARKAGRGHTYSHALSNASGLILAQVGAFFNFLKYRLTMDNSERGGSLKNIHAHYDLSNDLFTTFLDKETLMYSSAIFDAVKAPRPQTGLVFRGTLEQAQWRKLDTLLARAQVEPGQTLLDIGFGWGGLSIRAAKKYGCHVTGITLSVEQKALAEERVKAEGIQDLITFEVVDYRTFARRKENAGKFDRILSCEMIEAVGHNHLGEFFWAVEQLLAHDGILVMEAITTPEERYETYRRSTDFISTIIFPGSCCPSLHALVDAAYHNSCLTLEHIDNIGLHYAETLAEWRRRFNASEAFVRKLGFDDVFLRAWNYYLTYCEAGFFTQTENCLILVFSRPGCRALSPLCETRSVTQTPAMKIEEIKSWIGEGKKNQVSSVFKKIQ